MIIVFETCDPDLSGNNNCLLFTDDWFNLFPIREIRLIRCLKFILYNLSVYLSELPILGMLH